MGNKVVRQAEERDAREKAEQRLSGSAFIDGGRYQAEDGGGEHDPRRETQKAIHYPVRRVSDEGCGDRADSGSQGAPKARDKAGGDQLPV
jgi:hypothetical protein